MKMRYEFELNESGEGLMMFKVFEMFGAREHEMLAVELTPVEVEDLQAVLKEATK